MPQVALRNCIAGNEVDFEMWRPYRSNVFCHVPDAALAAIRWEEPGQLLSGRVGWMSASQKPIVVGERFTPLATFSGLKRVPFLAVSRNSLMASLVIGQDALAIRVIRLHVLRFEDIEAVSCGQRLGVSIQFSPKRGIRTFSANFRSKDPAAKTVLRRLAAAGVLLDASAQAVLQAE